MQSRRLIVKCLVGLFLLSPSPSAISAVYDEPARITIEYVPDTSGSMGTATITSAIPGWNQGYKSAMAFACGPSGLKWNSSNCDPYGHKIPAKVEVIEPIANFSDNPVITLPTIELIPLYFTYRDGTPARDLEVGYGGGTFRCTTTWSVVGHQGTCNWNPALFSPFVKASLNDPDRQSYFTDGEGKITLVVVKERKSGEEGEMGVELIYKKGYGGVSAQIDFSKVKANDRLVFNLESPSEEAEKIAAEAAKLCFPQTSGIVVNQIPACSDFASLPKLGVGIIVGNDPLTYQENTPNSVIALQGVNEREISSVETLTEKFCSSPKVLSGFNWVNKSQVYLIVSTGSEGMCRLKVTTTAGTVYVVQMPVASWSVSALRPPTISGNNLSNHGILPVGKSIQLSNLSFNYSGSTFQVGLVAPLYYTIKDENTCSVDANFLVFAKSSGECAIKFGWPEFAFGSRVYSSSSIEYVLFTVKSAAELAQDAEKIKYERQASAEKAKQDTKLCKTSDQSRLRNSYAPVKASNNRANALRSKLDRVNYLISQVGKNGPIQIPPSEYAELLSGYPVLANSRQVPIFVYQAILQGALIGERKYYQIAFTKANLAYSKASVGCKKVVGKP